MKIVSNTSSPYIPCSDRHVLENDDKLGNPQMGCSCKVATGKEQTEDMKHLVMMLKMKLH